MLKSETLTALENAFNIETKLRELEILPAPSVEIINMDLIRIYIYERIHPETIKQVIFKILQENSEPGPLNIHVETATSCKLTLYVDISSI